MWPGPLLEEAERSPSGTLGKPSDRRTEGLASPGGPWRPPPRDRFRASAAARCASETSRACPRAGGSSVRREGGGAGNAPAVRLGLVCCELRLEVAIGRSHAGNGRHAGPDAAGGRARPAQRHQDSFGRPSGTTLACARGGGTSLSQGFGATAPRTSRPPPVTFETTGFDWPNPRVVRRSLSTPCDVSHATTALARSSLSCLLRSAVPVLSMWPWTSTRLRRGFFRSASALSERSAFDWGRIVPGRREGDGPDLVPPCAEGRHRRLERGLAGTLWGVPYNMNLGIRDGDPCPSYVERPHAGADEGCGLTRQQRHPGAPGADSNGGRRATDEIGARVGHGCAAPVSRGATMLPGRLGQRARGETSARRARDAHRSQRHGEGETTPRHEASR